MLNLSDNLSELHIISSETLRLTMPATFTQFKYVIT